MSYSYSNIRISLENGSFFHNLKDDYGCFILWQQAKPYRDRIRELLSSEFEILLETEMEWSSYHFHDNASRLYSRPLYESIPKENRLSEHADKIGDNVFVLFVVKDSKPKYSYLKATSNIIEIGNLNIYDLKNQIRKLIYDETGAPYAVHSTISLYEFFFQMPLLLGPELFKDLLNGAKPSIKKISKDLEGADGWPNLETAFEVLNLTTNYLSLSSYDGLPADEGNSDITLLTDNYQQLASALNITQLSTDSYRGFVRINNNPIPIHIRFIGDNYHNTAWQKDMLNYKVNKEGLYVLRADMYFFSLLFRKVYNQAIKKDDIETLDKIAKTLSFTWYKKEAISNDEIVGQWLEGYFKAQGYHYEDPIDKSLYKNKQIIRHLPNQYTIVARESGKTRIKRKIKDMLPENVFLLLKKIVR